MDNENNKKPSDIASSILAKFQQVSKEKEEAAHKLIKTERYFQQDKRKKSGDHDSMHSGISEADAGITKYISNNSGFKGIVKHRFTDFQVHEIGLDGKVVELISTTIPEEVPQDEEVVHGDKSILSEEIWKEIEETIESDDKEAVTEIDVTNQDKDERTLIHKSLKSLYGGKICSNTVTKEDTTFIYVKKSSKKDRVCWPKNLPEYLHFTLSKINMDTTHCICLLSKKLRIKPNFFTYAGTKDRRAITTQRMCVKRKKAEEFINLENRSYQIGNYEYKSKPLRLGNLSGNKFTITIRNLESENSVIETAMDSLKKNGFINYFGLQRFGSSAAIPTYAIGKAILMKNWKLAVDLVLKPRPDEKSPPWIKQARESWWDSRDASKSLRFLSKNPHSLECRVLRALKQNSSDYYGALLTIPRNTLMLYLHSYQSLVWNKIVSMRIEKFKLEPLIGDLIIVPNTEVTSKEAQDMDEKNYEDIEVDDDNQEAPVEVEVIKKTVQALTKDDLLNVSINDIVYPLPGYDVIYPENEIAGWYKQILQDDGISESDLKSNNKMFSLYGTYRKAFEKVKNLEWNIVTHSNFDQDLVLSDLDKLQGKQLEKDEGSSDHQYRALILDMTLPPSTYATMVLREVMKMDTSVSFHALLTKNAQLNAAKRLKVSNEEPVNGDK